MDDLSQSMPGRSRVRSDADATMRAAAEELDDLAARAGWSYREIARRLRIGDTTVRQWANGRRAIPPMILPWLRRIVGTIEALGGPEGWRGGAHPDSVDADAA